MASNVNKIVPFSISRPTRLPPGDGLVLRRAIRGTGMAAQVIQTLRRQINLPRIVRHYCHHFTDLVPTRDGEEPLIVRGLRQAVNDHEHSLRAGQGEGVAYKKFVQGLIRDSDESLQWYVSCRPGGGESIWDPSQESLPTFWRRHGQEPRIRRRPIAWDTIENDEFRAILAVRFLLNRSDLTVLGGGLRGILEMSRT